MTKTKKIESIRGHFSVICADPPWRFQDQLAMSETRRGSSAQYATMGMEALKALPVREAAAEDAFLALWVPSALLTNGLELMAAWGFKHKGVYTWGKTAKHVVDKATRKGRITEYASNGLAFGMGHYFRGCTEHALFGVRGSPAIVGHSERNLELHPALKHSAKPEGLQDSLERMFPDVPKLEMFARRDRKGWTCTGLECPSSYGEDIAGWLTSRLSGVAAA